jgi:deferrochelatase/peroxidase EfeB
VNPRDAHGFEGRLVNRHRLMRRGMPYGEYAPEGQPVRDDEERGIHFIGLAASLARQFEFVQQQWVEYGDGARQGNDRDPITGNHAGGGKFMIQGVADPKDPPFMCTDLPAFVELRGGDYFFVPSISALRLIASGGVDPR